MESSNRAISKYDYVEGAGWERVVRVARLEREQADQRNHNRRRSRRKKPIMIKSQDYLKGTSARGYVSWRNGDPCRICWPVPQTRENTTLTTMMPVTVVRLASRDLQCDSAGPKARPSAWSVAVEAVNRAGD